MVAYSDQVLFINDSYFESEFYFHTQFEFQIEFKTEFYILFHLKINLSFTFYDVFKFKVTSKASLFYFLFQKFDLDMWSISAKINLVHSLITSF